ncbi:MAG: alpha/beta hydrolase [Rhodothermales bacterium]|nr:alpha/beta hydrolase [Rhodothermales bacterium]
MSLTDTASDPSALQAGSAAELLSWSLEGPKQAPLVVVLHGWGSSASVMRGFAARLSDRFRVLTLDLPGHGNAPIPKQAAGMEAHAQAVSDLVEALGGAAHFIGHSNGGRISLYMASRAPWSRQVRSLTLVSPSGVRRPRGPKYYARKWTATALKAPFQVLPPRLKEAGLDWLRHSLVWRLLGSSDYRSLEGPMRETFVQLVNTYVEDDLGRIDAPTLLFWGDKDEAIVRPQIDRLIESIPDCGLVVLPEAGHYGFLDDPDTVYTASGHFLDQLEAAS